ncbi:MAG: hypothetical protein ACOVP2_04640, partial [Armatimonadaceae bacterium]
MSGAAPTSQPYIINVQNTNTSSDVQNVTILGAYSYIGTTDTIHWGNGNNISITVGIANITYQ